MSDAFITSPASRFLRYVTFDTRSDAAVLRLSQNPELGDQMGHDIITASGSTLLGADDKAGVAEMMAAAEHLMAHPEIPHGRASCRPMKTRHRPARFT